MKKTLSHRNLDLDPCIIIIFELMEPDTEVYVCRGSFINDQNMRARTYVKCFCHGELKYKRSTTVYMLYDTTPGFTTSSHTTPHDTTPPLTSSLWPLLRFLFPPCSPCRPQTSALTSRQHHVRCLSCILEVNSIQIENEKVTAWCIFECICVFEKGICLCESGPKAIFVFDTKNQPPPKKTV